MTLLGSQISQEEIILAVQEEDSVENAAKKLGVSKSALYEYLKKSGRKKERKGTAEVVKKDEDSFDIIALVKDRVGPEKIVEDLGFDTEFWEVKKFRYNQWTVSGKKKEGQDEKGNWKPETLWDKPNFQVTISIERKFKKPIEDAFRKISKSWSKPPKIGRLKRKKKTGQKLLEVSLFDVHLGKKSFPSEKNDLDNIVKEYCCAIDHAVKKASEEEIEKILFIVGSDFLNFDNWNKTTTKGTIIENSGEHYTTLFESAFKCIRDSIYKLLSVAPVDVVWIAGNHDRQASFDLCHSVRCWFEAAETKDITFDLSSRSRKYYRYGVNLIGLAHGDGAKEKDLPMLMATESRDFSSCKERTFHIGHKHSRNTRSYYSINSLSTSSGGAVRVEVLQSISETDFYHHHNGWISENRYAEFFIWDKEKGSEGYFTHKV